MSGLLHSARRLLGMTHAMPDSKPDGTPFEVVLPPDDWKARLNAQEYRVLREGGTEPAYTGEYTDTETEGIYSCRACGHELFRSIEKFHSHCGWPSFYAPLAGESVLYIEDTTMGMRRVEVRCSHCGSHLGHVFEGEGYGTPTDQRYCINSVCLTLTPTPSQQP
ncbi:unannotated protein [freshwater metagenome]|uniref:peptide-methionine (R)-S-oxide reductase n=1 Tax=freshwater metagenome TaxID=449393 RepID=A0A6J7LHZ2_9ZZZZ